MQKNISVIIVVNDDFESLEKVILSYNTQTFRNFEVIIVNLNASQKVKETIFSLQSEVFFPLIYIESKIEKSEKTYLKEALNISSTNYILISTGSSLVRPDFLEQHIMNRVESSFLVGSDFSIPKKIVDKINKEIIYTSQCFDSNWLNKNGFASFFGVYSIVKSGTLNNFIDYLFSCKYEKGKGNISAWKSDFMMINDFDSDLEVQFKKNGLKSKNVKYKAVSLNLKS